MNFLKNLLSRTCVNTVIILTAFYGFVTLDQQEIASIPFTSFLSLFGIGAFIAIAGLVFKINTIPYYARIIINYVLLLGSIFGIMLSTGQLSSKGPSVYIVITFGFAVIYAVVFLLSRIIAKALGKKTKSDKQSGVKKAEYKPLYK